MAYAWFYPPTEKGDPKVPQVVELWLVLAQKTPASNAATVYNVPSAESSTVAN